MASETLADIVAEMRYGTVPKHRTDHELLAIYADRIEAATGRSPAMESERESVTGGHGLGNAAAMYEALRTLRQRFNNNVMAYQDRYLKFSGWHWHKKAAEAARWRDVFYELREACDAALAAPERNCDAGAAGEQAKRLSEWCSGRHCANCQFKGGWPDECKLQWAQMPYEEGGAK